MRSFLKKLIVMDNGHRRTLLCLRSVRVLEPLLKEKVFRISTRAIIIKDENCEMNLFVYLEVMIQYACASKNLWIPG